MSGFQIQVIRDNLAKAADAAGAVNPLVRREVLAVVGPILESVGILAEDSEKARERRVKGNRILMAMVGPEPAALKKLQGVVPEDIWPDVRELFEEIKEEAGNV